MGWARGVQWLVLKLESCRKNVSLGCGRSSTAVAGVPHVLRLLAPLLPRRSGRWRRRTSLGTSSGAAAARASMVHMPAGARMSGPSCSGVPGCAWVCLLRALVPVPHPLKSCWPPLPPCSPLLSEGDFEAKPSVLLLGQYSTGKSTFIKYLLVRGGGETLPPIGDCQA